MGFLKREAGSPLDAPHPCSFEVVKLPGCWEETTQKGVSGSQLFLISQGHSEERALHRVRYNQSLFPRTKMEPMASTLLSTPDDALSLS